jgi:hypothetical protein
MPAELTPDGLGIACVFSDGRRRTFTVAGVAPAPLAADLLAGLAGLVHPHGTVDAPATAGCYLTGLKDLAAFAHARGLFGGAAALTRGLLAEYWLQAGWLAELTTRRMLAGYDTATGALAPGVRDLAGGRLFSAAPTSTPLAPYPAEEWERLHAACRTAAGEAFAAHRLMQAAARRGGDPRELGWSQDNIAWLLAERGPATATDVAGYLGRTNRWVELRGGVRPVCHALYPGVHTVIAYRLLLGIHTGVVPDGIADLGLADLDWAGDATILLGYVKGRRAAESLTLPGKAVRLLEQWLAHSAPARAYAPAALRGHLWLHYNYYAPRGGGDPDRWWMTQIPAPTQRAWAAHRGLAVDRRRIRTTYLSLRDRRAWHGSSRSLVDPNHSPAVEGDSYLTAATPAQAQAVEAVIAEAQQDMLRRAQPPAVVTDTAAAVAGFPRLAARLGGTDTALEALAGGAQDVFAAACADPVAGLHGPPGKPCPARPWVCLLCPLAVFTPRHAANLLRLKAFFARQWRAMPSAQFMAVFGPYATRIDEVLARYPATVLATAATSVTDHDDELPLRPEERSA